MSYLVAWFKVVCALFVALFFWGLLLWSCGFLWALVSVCARSGFAAAQALLQ